MNAYEVKRQAWCLLQVKLCDPCLSALKWFVYHARRYTSARLYLLRSTDREWTGVKRNKVRGDVSRDSTRRASHNGKW